VDVSWFEFLLEKDLDMLTVHGRTRKEMSKVPAHWDLIGQVRELRDTLAPQTLLVGNGDAMNHAHGVELAGQYGLDGIMIGRGIFQDPYAFAAKSPWENVPRDERIALYLRQVTLFAETWRAGERNIKTLNRFCKIYVNGFDGAKELREALMAAPDTDELTRILTDSLS
jgi:tRNA-dihydrouridine synthase